jgi:hypothetical protein
MRERTNLLLQSLLLQSLLLQRMLRVLKVARYYLANCQLPTANCQLPTAWVSHAQHRLSDQPKPTVCIATK